jgi:uncharacterized membrane protein YhaH (DUF805 family)
MNLKDAIRSVLKNILNFTGRAGLREFWLWIVFSLGVSVLNAFANYKIPNYSGAVVGVGLFLLMPAVLVRRLRDAGQNLWKLLLIFVPFGSLYLLFCLTKPSFDYTGKI